MRPGHFARRKRGAHVFEDDSVARQHAKAFLSLRWRCAPAFGRKETRRSPVTKALSFSAAFLRKASRLRNDLG
jgi:hypothetical protein